jgi:tetratricopeptide (TPR) repeat protein
MRAYEGLAYEYLRAGRIRDAEIAYRSYLAYNPADAKSMVLLADALGSVADALRQTGPPGQVIVGGEGRREARVAQLRLYRLALDTWARIGLVRGRGSPELLRHVQRARVKAAVDLGDVVEAKRANDDLLRLDGVDPDDPDAVLASAPYERRKTRLNLALQVLVQKPPRDLSQAMRKMYLSKRATILRDVEIAPSRTDAEALARLLPVYRKLTGEPQAGPEETANLALLLEELGDGKEAAEVRRRAMARWPDSPLFRSGT